MIDVFVSAPYTNSDLDVQSANGVLIEKYIVYLLNQNLIPHSPVTAMLSIAHNNNLKTTYGYWQRYCERFVDMSNEVHVLKLDGWDSSIGVAGEIQYAATQLKKIVYVTKEFVESCP